MPISCQQCGASWSEGSFSEDCAACGGGAMDRACLVCEGACGAEWRRAVVDSQDSGEAHWIGACDYEWWLDEPALPTLRWAQLKRGDGHEFVIWCEGEAFHFTTIGETLLWFSDEDYIPYKDAIADGLIAATTKAPTGVR